jgi:hypothetical protein
MSVKNQSRNNFGNEHGNHWNKMQVALFHQNFYFKKIYRLPAMVRLRDFENAAAFPFPTRRGTGFF